MLKFAVVPHAGTWIEIFVAVVVSLDAFVVPHAGTWIEIPPYDIGDLWSQSFPTRERGLK